MRRILLPFARLLHTKSTRPQARQGRRLNLESLEERTTPSTFSGSIVGTAVVNNGSNFALAGATITLTGSTNQNAPVSATTQTDANGNYVFQNVLPGTYLLTCAETNYTGAQSQTVVVNPSNTVAQNVGFNGLSASAINLGMFLNTTSRASFQFTSAGMGTALAESTADFFPFAERSLLTVNGVENGRNVVDLSGSVGDQNLSSTIVEFDTSLGNFDVQLFDSRAPQTVANFLDYVQDGNYNNAIFTRLVSGFVLQGGGLTVGSSGSTTTLQPTKDLGTGVDVPSEYTASNGAKQNVTGTLAMALGSGNPNSGSKEFFFNLADNSSNLDPQNFTVFGQVIDAPTASGTITADSTPLTSLLSQVTSTNESSTSFAGTAGVDLQNVPLVGKQTANDSNFPSDIPASDFFTIKNVKVVSQPEALTYSIVSNSNSGLVKAALTNNYLTLDYTTGQTGSADVFIQATDKDGATLGTPFDVHVNVSTPPPVAGTVTISPDSTTAVTQLTAKTTITDANGDTTFPNTTYQWFQLKAGSTTPTAISGATSQTLSLSGLSVAQGDQFTVAVTPKDGSVAGATVTSKPVTIGAVSPSVTLAATTVTSLSVKADNPSAVTQLTATAVGNEDGNAAGVTYTYTWTLSGSDVNGSKVVGTGATLNVNSTTFQNASGGTVAAGDSLTVTATPSDGGTAYTATVPLTIGVTSGVNTFALTVPTVTAPTISVNSTGHVLSVTPSGTDTLGSTRLGFQYQWFHNGVAIAGATTSSLDLTSPGLTVNLNDFFTVKVTPTDTVTSSGQSTITLGTQVTSTGFSYVTNTNPLTVTNH